MPSTPAADLFSAVNQRVLARRQQRTASLELALDRLRPGWRAQRRLDPGPQLRYALLHHTLYEAQQAAASADHARARRALAVWDHPLGELACLADTPLGPLAVVSARACAASEDARFLSPAFAATWRALAAPPPVPAPYLAGAVAYVGEAGLLHYLTPLLGLVVLVAHRDPLAPTQSYSLTAFPGTVYVDWTVDAVRFGETLLHEAAHTWLNEALRAYGERLPEQPRWYSPWKQELRPAFGIVHAAFAFSLLAQYFHSVATAEEAPVQARQYCRSRAEGELPALVSSLPSIGEALDCLASAELRGLVDLELEHAVAGSPQAEVAGPPLAAGAATP